MHLNADGENMDGSATTSYPGDQYGDQYFEHYRQDSESDTLDSPRPNSFTGQLAPWDLATTSRRSSFVKAWTSRGRLPQSIESTSALVQVCLRDAGLFSSMSELELRQQYSMAFIRFVNGIVDAAQKGAFPISVAAMANRLGLPAWFVELRHAATHDKIPTISLLRSGAAQGLEWLDKNYWAVQSTFVEDATHSVTTAVRAYKTAAKAASKGQDTESSLLEAFNELESVLTIDTYPEILVPILLDLGFLVPLAKK
eukprot:jgi/Hompol1/6218/HPOL_002217-RA